MADMHHQSFDSEIAFRVVPLTRTSVPAFVGALEHPFKAASEHVGSLHPVESESR
jgi:hypothetical protein